MSGFDGAEVVNRGDSSVLGSEGAQAVLERYIEAVGSADARAVADLFAPGAVLRDPIDGPAHHGREQIRLFFDESFHAQGPITMAVEGAVRVAGRYVAAAMTATIPSGTRTLHIDTMDVFLLDHNGLILSMAAYWGASNMRFLS